MKILTDKEKQKLRDRRVDVLENAGMDIKATMVANGVTLIQKDNKLFLSCDIFRGGEGPLYIWFMDL